MRIVPFAVLTALPLLAGSCSSFSTVRSAEVRPGPSLALQASTTTSMKGVAGWIWSVYCVVECDRAMVGGDAEFMVGWPTVGRIRAVELGAGVNGLQPYVDGYLQLAGGRRPFGIGGRLGLPLMDWMDHQLYARYDVPMGRTTRLMLNPALFIHEGGAGSFTAFVQGVGLLFEGDRASFTPSLALVAGRARRRTEGFDVGPVGSVFGTASLAMTFHRRRRAVP